MKYEKSCRNCEHDHLASCEGCTTFHDGFELRSELAKIENGTMIELPQNLILDEYDRTKIMSITCEEIRFAKGQKVYKVYDSAVHFANRKPVKPNYKLVEGTVREVCHKYDNPYSNHFRVVVAVNIDEKGTHSYFSQENMFDNKEAAEARLKELRELEK